MIGFGQAGERAERLLKLACALQIGRLSLDDLRRRFDLYTDGDLESTRRMFERDKQDLRDLGLDVVTRTLGDDDRYWIPSSLPSVAVSWTEEEMVALATLSAAVGDQVSGTALAKVSVTRDVMPDEWATARIRVDLEVPAALVAAHAHGRRVTFDYRTAAGEVSMRTVEPWAIATRRGQTYVTAWDVDRADGRAFRVDRIVGAVVDVGEAEHARPTDGLGTPLAPEQRSDVRLRVPEARLPDAAAMGAHVLGEVDEAGRVAVELRNVRDEAAIGWSLRHRAEVISPAHVADAVADRRERLAELHAGAPSLDELDAAPSRRPRRAGLSHERLARLLALPEWLSQRSGITVPEMATAFGADPAEVYAELELLDVLELPGVGYVGELTMFADGQVTYRALQPAPRMELTTVEAVHLLSLVEAARLLLPPDRASTLDGVAARLRGVLAGAADAIRLVELDTPTLATLREVVGTDAVVTFAYRGRHDDEAARRRVRPLQLQLLGGALYLSAVDLDADEPRSFRLDRMHDVEVVDDPTRLVEGEVTDPGYVSVGDEVAVELRLTTQATWILRLLAPTRRVELGDGEVHALVHTDVPDWLLAHVRAAGGQAELLRPADLRGALAMT